MVKSGRVRDCLHVLLEPQCEDASLTKIKIRNSQTSQQHFSFTELACKVGPQISTNQHLACLTKAVEEVILGPPDAPDTNFTFPLLSNTMAGLMLDSGLFPGARTNKTEVQNKF